MGIPCSMCPVHRAISTSGSRGGSTFGWIVSSEKSTSGFAGASTEEPRHGLKLCKPNTPPENQSSTVSGNGTEFFLSSFQNKPKAKVQPSPPPTGPVLSPLFT